MVIDFGPCPIRPFGMYVLLFFLVSLMFNENCSSGRHVGMSGKDFQRSEKSGKPEQFQRIDKKKAEGNSE